MKSCSSIQALFVRQRQTFLLPCKAYVLPRIDHQQRMKKCILLFFISLSQFIITAMRLHCHHTCSHFSATNLQTALEFFNESFHHSRRASLEIPQAQNMHMQRMWYCLQKSRAPCLFNAPIDRLYIDLGSSLLAQMRTLANRSSLLHCSIF